MMIWSLIAMAYFCLLCQNPFYVPLVTLPDVFYFYKIGAGPGTSEGPFAVCPKCFDDWTTHVKENPNLGRSDVLLNDIRRLAVSYPNYEMSLPLHDRLVREAEEVEEIHKGRTQLLADLKSTVRAKQMKGRRRFFPIGQPPPRSSLAQAEIDTVPSSSDCSGAGFCPECRRALPSVPG